MSPPNSLWKPLFHSVTEGGKKTKENMTNSQPRNICSGPVLFPTGKQSNHPGSKGVLPPRPTQQPRQNKEGKSCVPRRIPRRIQSKSRGDTGEHHPYLVPGRPKAPPSTGHCERKKSEALTNLKRPDTTPTLGRSETRTIYPYAHTIDPPMTTSIEDIILPFITLSKESISFNKLTYGTVIKS